MSVCIVVDTACTRIKAGWKPHAKIKRLILLGEIYWVKDRLASWKLRYGYFESWKLPGFEIKKNSGQHSENNLKYLLHPILHLIDSASRCT